MKLFILQSVKSATLFDKPEVLKASQPSLSNHSNVEESNFSETARYNVSIHLYSCRAIVDDL